MPHFQKSSVAYKSFWPQPCPQDSDSLLSPSVTSHRTIYPRGLGHLCHRMHYCKGNSDQDLCHDSSACGEKGWMRHSSTGCCHESPMGATDLPPCHDPGSLSHDIEGSCQSEPQGCQPMEPCPPWRCCPPQQSCNFGKPRRRVESRAAISPLF
ncbi:uncharacterized protein LOC115346347 isoform X2 [Aquila chrysaetos chrysaetos]|uniref:uncharacterized protein LOC115346347 isoform X2 n=1 Tax=Aquila chrysaetos chrysaetos TaxID=223781 RepID=UPI0011771E32|nr:uncharacterized protein LOC115346347 isoform X2 [Aquila chrysaetos chrysaetos]